MSDDGSEGGSAGRARGRARGRPPSREGEEIGSHSPGSGSGSGDNQGTVRGRGGYRPQNTIPAGITSTVGSGGSNVRLYANYFRLQTNPSLIVHDYHVTFEPDVENTRVRRGMMYDHRATFNGAYVFDGMANLKSTTHLPGKTELFSTRRTDDVQIKITVQHANEVDWTSPEMVRMYNTQVRRNLQHMKYLLVGRHFFNPSEKHTIPEHKITLWGGVLTAVAHHDGGVLMVCDTVHKIIRADNVLTILTEIKNRNPSEMKENARRELVGSIVLTSYNNRTYKIDDIDFDTNPEKFEFDKKGQMMNLLTYYKQQHDITIKVPKQPLIKCLPSERDKRAGQDKPLYLIPELCQMTGLTDSMRSNIQLKKQMTQMTQVAPPGRVKNLFEFTQKMKNNPDCQTDMSKWNMNFEDKPIEITGRLLAGEKILMLNDAEGAAYDQKSGDFSKEMRAKKMREVPPTLKAWGIICSKRDANAMEEFKKTIDRVWRPLGITMEKPKEMMLENDRTGTFVEACRKVPDSADLIVIIVPNDNKERYDTIKKIFCIDKPIPSQVIKSRTLGNPKSLMSVCTKVGVQIGAKLGGVPWALTIPPKALMVVGYDTHHDGTRRGQSVGGFVCSLNPSLTRYFSRVSFHSTKEELSSNFHQDFVEGLKAYHRVNGTYPERIVVYRDGVSDGQIPHVYDIEMPQIRSGLKEVAGEAPIKLAFVIVTKRVNARFFLRNAPAPTQVENPVPGTVVDNEVTRRDRYDFYLVSQSTRQGTVAPTSYNIIEDNTNWKPNHHQQLAYKLCHLYFNWMGTVRVPAPCQYAHKLAYLTGTALHREPSVRLSDKLFFL